MKIGILTLPFNNNYGGYLQAYALMKILKDLGHDPTMIMRRHNKRSVSSSYRIKFFIKGLLKTILKCRHYTLLYNPEVSFYESGVNMIPFLNKYISPQTTYMYSTNELKDYCKERFDAYVVGSDQVWRAIYGPHIEDYFLGFTAGWKVKRYSYAASFGTDTPEYTKEQIAHCSNLIQSFDAVSLREDSGVDVIKNFGWHTNELKTVLDPTLLLKADDYNKLIRNVPVRKDYIFSYVLDETKVSDEIINTIVSTLRLPITSIGNIQKMKEPLPSVESWLAHFRDADYIITDSFHGTLFSIIYNKAFLVLENEGRGSSRFTNLLRQFGLEKRIVNNNEDAKLVISSEINWKEVNEILNRHKRQSFEFLNKI